MPCHAEFILQTDRISAVWKVPNYYSYLLIYHCRYLIIPGVSAQCCTPRNSTCRQHVFIWFTASCIFNCSHCFTARMFLTLTTVVCDYTSTFSVRTNSWQRRCVVPSELGLATSHAGGARDHQLATLLQLLCPTRGSYFKYFWQQRNIQL
jgi:hypothetical protein